MSELTKPMLKPLFTNDWMNKFFKTDFPDTWGNKFIDTVPSVNISEGTDNYKVEMAAPGLNKDNIKVNMDDRVLTISYESKDEKKTGDKNYTKREYNYTSFTRSFELPENADENKVDAKYEHGELLLTIPKKVLDTKKIARTITIS